MAARVDPTVRVLRELGLLVGAGKAPKGLLALVHAGRVVGGLSISLRATPDEVFGSLVQALGGAATRLRLLDVRTGQPPVLEVQWGELREKWEVEDVAGLVHNLNDLFRDERDVRLGLVLGEWEDMLEVLCVPKALAPKLFASRLLDGARNASAVRRLLEPRDAPEW